MSAIHNAFEGQRVRLRAVEPTDAADIFRFRQDSDIVRREGRFDWPQSLAGIQRALDAPAPAQRSDNSSLIIETLDGTAVGELNIQIADPRHGTFALGIGLGDRSAWGKGYAGEAMLLALRHMFHERRYQKCNLGVYAFNQHALGMYRHLGFVDEGRVRRSFFSNGRYHDELLLGMTIEEFDQLYPEWRIAQEA